MANELKIQALLEYVNGNDGAEVDDQPIYIDVSGTEYIDKVVSIGLTAENIGVDDIATPGFVYFKNLDATNFVEWGDDADSPTGKMLATEFAGPIRWGATNISMKADTAACRVRVVVIEA